MNFLDLNVAFAELLPAIGTHHLSVNMLRKTAKNGEIPKWVNSWVKRACSRAKPYFVVESSGVKLIGDMRDRYSRHLVAEPNSEAATVELILKHRKPGVFLDVGANLGALAWAVASKTTDMCVAVEPDAATAKRAAAAVILNAIPNGKVIAAAAGDHSGTVALYSHPGQSESASLIATHLGDKATEAMVPMVTVDQIRDAIGQPVGFLKVDVEGHEPAVIRGAEQTIRSDAPTILFEYHWDIAPKLGWAAEDVRELISNWGRYDFHTMYYDGREGVFPPQPEDGLVANILAIPHENE